MDEVTPRRNSQTRDEWGPDAAGATSDPSPPKETQEGPGGGPSCVIPAVPVADLASNETNADTRYLQAAGEEEQRTWAGCVH